MTNESYYSSILSKAINLSKRAYCWKINDNYEGGVPDLYIEGPKATMFVEAKKVTIPKRKNTKVNFRKGGIILSYNQQAWAERAVANNQDWRLLMYTTEGWALLYWPETALDWDCVSIRAVVKDRHEIIKDIMETVCGT